MNNNKNKTEQKKWEDFKSLRLSLNISPQKIPYKLIHKIPKYIKINYDKDYVNILFFLKAWKYKWQVSDKIISKNMLLEKKNNVCIFSIEGYQWGRYDGQWIKKDKRMNTDDIIVHLRLTSLLSQFILYIKKENLCALELFMSRFPSIIANNDEGNMALQLILNKIECSNYEDLSSEWDIVKYLIKNGADINIKSKNKKQTALHIISYRANEYNNIDIVEYLVEHGAAIDIKTEDGLTALLLATQYGDLDIVEYLIEKGADINEIDNDNNTALIFASVKDN